MCRELKREPAWVAAVRLALLQGRLDVDSVMAEANFVDGRESTVEDVLTTMVDRELLTKAPAFDTTGDYLPGPVLLDAAPKPLRNLNAAHRGSCQWGTQTQRA